MRRQYKLAYGLPLDRGLVGEGLRGQRAEQMRQVMAGPDGQRRRQLGREHAGEGGTTADPAMVRRGAQFRPPDHQERVAESLRERVPPIVCTVCGAEFRPVNRDTVTCSASCWSVLASRRARTRRRDPARDAEMLGLREQGWTIPAIASRYGLTVSGVRHAIQRARA